LHFLGFLNKNSPWAHIELELTVFGVAEKLRQNPINMCKKNSKRPEFGFKGLNHIFDVIAYIKICNPKVTKIDRALVHDTGLHPYFCPC
jgi:hypothetical protein